MFARQVEGRIGRAAGPELSVTRPVVLGISPLCCPPGPVFCLAAGRHWDQCRASLLRKKRTDRKDSKKGIWCLMEVKKGSKSLPLFNGNLYYFHLLPARDNRKWAFTTNCVNFLKTFLTVDQDNANNVCYQFLSYIYLTISCPLTLNFTYG